MLSLLEDSGYLPRLATLVDNIFHKLGMHGYGIIPLFLGMGCNVPGALATRSLETRKQRFIAATLLAIAVPCMAQMAMILGILGKYGLYYIGLVFLSLGILYVIIGFILMIAAVLALIPGKMTWMLFSSAAVFGFAYGTCVASQSPLVADLFGLNALGVILGFLSFGFMVGGAIGPLLTAYIFDIEQCYTLAFLLCAGINLAGLALSGLLRTGR